MNLFRSGILGLGLAAAMSGFNSVAPPIGGRPTPTFQSLAVGVGRDGDGKRLRPKVQPNHGARFRTRAWREYAARVVATHSDRPDPRADKYLHAHARRRRAMAGLAVASLRATGHN